MRQQPRPFAVREIAPPHDHANGPGHEAVQRSAGQALDDRSRRAHRQGDRVQSRRRGKRRRGGRGRPSCARTRTRYWARVRKPSQSMAAQGADGEAGGSGAVVQGRLHGGDSGDRAGQGRTPPPPLLSPRQRHQHQAQADQVPPLEQACAVSRVSAVLWASNRSRSMIGPTTSRSAYGASCRPAAALRTAWAIMEQCTRATASWQTSSAS